MDGQGYFNDHAWKNIIDCVEIALEYRINLCNWMITMPVITVRRTAVLKYELKTYSSWIGSYRDDLPEDYILAIRRKHHWYIYWKFLAILDICLNVPGHIKIIAYENMCGLSKFPHELQLMISTGLPFTWRTTIAYRFNNMSCSESRIVTFTLGKVYAV